MVAGMRQRQVNTPKLKASLPPLLLLLLFLGPTTSLYEPSPVRKGGEASPFRAKTSEGTAAWRRGRALTQAGWSRLVHSGRKPQTRKFKGPHRSDSGNFGRRRQNELEGKSLLHTREIEHDGYARQYRIFFPSLPSGRLPRDGVPLLVALHCFGCSDTTFEYLAPYCEVCPGHLGTSNHSQTSLCSSKQQD